MRAQQQVLIGVVASNGLIPSPAKIESPIGIRLCDHMNPDSELAEKRPSGRSFERGLDIRSVLPWCLFRESDKPNAGPTSLPVPGDPNAAAITCRNANAGQGLSRRSRSDINEYQGLSGARCAAAEGLPWPPRRAFGDRSRR